MAQPAPPRPEEPSDPQSGTAPQPDAGSRSGAGSQSSTDARSGVPPQFSGPPASALPPQFSGPPTSALPPYSGTQPPGPHASDPYPPGPHASDPYPPGPRPSHPYASSPYVSDPYPPGPHASGALSGGGPRPEPPGASEATRLLCVGVHYDRAFREAVMDELYVHEERFPAPSVGIDAGRVLSHAVKARRNEIGWSLALLVAWMATVRIGGPLLISFLLLSLMLNAARWLRGRAERAPLIRRAPAFLLRWYARICLSLMFLFLAMALFADYWGDASTSASRDGLSNPYYGSGPGDGGPGVGEILRLGFVAAVGVQRDDAALVAFLLLVMAVLVGLRRGQFSRIVANELSARRFPVASGDPAEIRAGRRTDRLRARLRAEQHQPLVMYDPARPFCGFGTPFETWSLAVELRPRAGRVPEPMDNREILRRTIPLLEALRVPSRRDTPGVADAVLDRLRELWIDECVFLPADRLERRDGAPYHPEALEAHRRESVEEGGEARRHFLRIRVGGWGEELVVTVFVRVHTQGGMLMLEFAPHLLTPVREEFRQAERHARRHLNNSWPGRAAWAVTHTPGSVGEAVLTLIQAARGGLLRLLSGNAGAPAEGPRFSVRELGSDPDSSLFQDMDVSRYLRTVQERVTGGVRVALREAGWQTEEFEQKIVNVSGGVYIESARDSAISVGDHNTVGHHRNDGGRGAPGGTPDAPQGPGGASAPASGT